MSNTVGDLSLDDKLDLFCDFLDSDEWIFPVQSFIDYYCTVFNSEDPEDSYTEKQVVFKEYKEIVCSNLDKFLQDVLGLTREKDLPMLLQEYDGEYDELEYLLAVEDYDIFHNFMWEENQELDRQAQGRFKKGSARQMGAGAGGGLRDLEGAGPGGGPGAGQSREDLELEAALKASQTMEAESKKKAMTEEEELMEAIRLSQMDQNSHKTEQMRLKEQEDEELRNAIAASEAAELERQETLKAKKLKTEARKQQLAQEQRDKEAKMEAEVLKHKEEMKQEELKALDTLQNEIDKQMIIDAAKAAEEKRIKEEGEARRQAMLQKLKEQAEAADKKIAAAQASIGKNVPASLSGSTQSTMSGSAQSTMAGSAQRQNLPVLQAAGTNMARPLNDLPVLGSKPVQKIEPIEEVNIDAGPKAETLEERQKRLRERAAALKNKNQEESKVEAPKVDKPEADVFRRTGLKWGETADEKKARLARCVNALKNVSVGQSSAFKPLEGLSSDPRNLGFNTRQEVQDEDSDCDITQAEVEVLNKGSVKRAKAKAMEL